MTTLYVYGEVPPAALKAKVLLTARVFVVGEMANGPVTVTAELLVLPKLSVTVTVTDAAELGAVNAPVELLMDPAVVE